MAKMEARLREQWEKAAEEKGSTFNEPKLEYLRGLTRILFERMRSINTEFLPRDKDTD